MKITHNKKISGGKVYVVLDAGNFSLQEIKAIRALGEPSIVFNKTYKMSDTEINIDKPVTKFTKQQFIFDAKLSTIVNVSEEASSFIIDIEEIFATIMGELVGEYMRLTAVDNDTTVIGPAKPYPEKPGKPDQPEKPDKPDKPDINKEETGYIEIVDEIPADLPDNKLVGLILDDEDGN